MNIMLPESHEWEMRPRWWMNISIVRLFPWNYAEEQNQESRFWNKYLFGQYFIFSTTYYLHKIRLQDDKTLHHCNIINNKHAQIIFLVGVPVHCSKRGNKILHRLHTLYIVDDTNDAQEEHLLGTQVATLCPYGWIIIFLIFRIHNKMKYNENKKDKRNI